MIRLEYDVPTAGVRASFVVVDGVRSMPTERQFVGGVSKEGSWTAPQNPENIKILIAMLESMLDKS